MQISDTSNKSLESPVQSIQWRQFHLDLYLSIEPIRRAWDDFIDDRNVFLSTGYLLGLERCPPAGMSFFYIAVRTENTVGVIYLQLENFNAGKSLNYARLETGASQNRQSGVVRSLKEFVAGRIGFYSLLCGNTFVTGNHGYLLDDSIDRDTELQLIHDTIGWVKEYSSKQGNNVRLVFIKDFFDPRFTDLHEKIGCAQYHQFTAQPNMIMQISESWKNYTDYLGSLHSKYRIRARRARKKRTDIVKKELRLEDIEIERASLHDLYRRIANQASFNLFILSEGYFASIKRHMGDAFRVFGYYSGDKLVAFFSLMENGDELEAHFLGYESVVNRQKQLYLNMLLDMIEIAIERQISRIVFSRTAMEIKSSVGAKPYNMHFYLQHSSAITNKFLPKLYKMLDPRVDWIPRNPFKETTLQTSDKPA